MFDYKGRYDAIMASLERGFTIQVTSMTQSRLYRKQEDFKFNSDGLYARSGRSWLNITYCNVRAIKL